MTELCREFGISRKTGYKIFDRYKEHGLKALSDRSRRPVRYANQLPSQVESLIVTCRPKAPSMPSSIVTASLNAWANGAPAQQARRSQRPWRPMICGAPTSRASSSLETAATAIPLRSQTRPRASCSCANLDTVREDVAVTAFERLFAERGLPQAIRSDNGVPFASPNALFNLSKLAVWWLRLGIAIERIKPGHPQQNGRHERMHLTLKKEATRPPGMHSLQQQARFDDFVHEFNAERPHEAIAMKCPAEVYTPSRRPYQGLPDLEYPFHDRDVLVTACGRICIYRKKINVSTVLAGQRLGIKEVDEGIWLVSFIDYDLGYIDLEQRTLQPVDNPFGPRLSPMSLVRFVTHVSGLDSLSRYSGGGT